MAAKIAKIVQSADPAIEQILEEFLAEQRTRLKPRTFSDYESVIDLLEHHLNGYGYESLSKAERSLFEKHFNAEGKEHREFCQLFGPEKIPENLGGFLGYFMIRKVMAGADFKRAAGTVMKKLSKWLMAKGYISAEAGQEGAERAADATKELPNAERAAQLLRDAARRLVFPGGPLNPAIDPDDLADEDYMDFDHYPIAKVEPGSLWLENPESHEDSPLGPIHVPKKATELLKDGWEISCALGRIKGKWRIIEMANVYPS